MPPPTSRRAALRESEEVRQQRGNPGEARRRATMALSRRSRLAASMCEVLCDVRRRCGALHHYAARGSLRRKVADRTRSRYHADRPARQSRHVLAKCRPRILEPGSGDAQAG